MADVLVQAVSYDSGKCALTFAGERFDAPQSLHLGYHKRFSGGYFNKGEVIRFITGNWDAAVEPGTYVCVYRLHDDSDSVIVGFGS